MPQWTMRLELTDGIDRYVVGITLDRDIIFSGMSWRLAEEMGIAAEISVAPVSVDADGFISMVKRREFRRTGLSDAAKLLALQVSDHLEDCEGWHGTERAEKALGSRQCTGGSGEPLTPEQDVN